MELAWSYLCLAGLWLMAVIGSGFNARLTAQTALGLSGAAACLTALAIAGALAIWSLAGFWAVAILYAALPWLGWTFRLAGAAFLLYLGTRRLVETLGRGPPVVIHGFRTLGPVQSVTLGFFTNLADPLIPLAALSLFATVPTAGPDAWFGHGGALLMSGVALLWYLALAARCGTPRGYARLMRLQVWISRAAGLGLTAAACVMLLS